MFVVAGLLVTVFLNMNSPAVAATARHVAGPAIPPAVAEAQIAPAAAPSRENSEAITAQLEQSLMPPMPALQLPGEVPVSLFKPAMPERIPEPIVETKTYNGKTYKYVKTITLRVTAYAADPRCTWPYPGTTTASGLSVKTNGGKLVASDPSVIPLHSLVVVPGYAASNAVPVLDTGGAIKGKRLDVLLPSFEKAQNWGNKTLAVKVYAPLK